MPKNNKIGSFIGGVTALTAIVAGAGVTYAIYGNDENKKGFDFKNDLDLIQDPLKSTFTDLSSIQPATAGTIRTAQELGIIEPKFSEGVTATYGFALDWDGRTGNPLIIVMLHKGDQTVSKPAEIVPTFNFSNDEALLQDQYQSTKDWNELRTLDLSPGAVVTPQQLGITEPQFSGGVTATYAIYQYWDDENGNGYENLRITVTLHKWNQTTTKDIEIEARYEFLGDLARIQDQTQSTFSDLTNIQSANAGDVITDLSTLGINRPQFTDGVTATYTFDQDWTGSGNPQIRVTLHKGTQTDSKVTEIVRDRPFNFSNDLAKIQDNTHSNWTLQRLLSNIKNNLNTGTAITASTLGIEEPQFSNGVTASYVIGQGPDGDIGTGNPIVKVTLHKGEHTSSTFTTITTNSFDFSNDLSKIYNQMYESSSDLNQINEGSAGDSIPSFRLNMNEIDFTHGVTATYEFAQNWDGRTGYPHIRVTLHKGNETASKVFELLPHFDFTNDLAKIRPQINSHYADLTSIYHNIGESVGTNLYAHTVTAQQLGITEPQLSEGVSVSYTFREDTISRDHILIQVTLRKNNIRDGKQFSVISANSFNFSHDMSLIHTPIQSTKTLADFSNILHTNNGDYVTAQELGITEPQFSAGVTATYRFALDWDGVDSRGPLINIWLHKGNEISQTIYTFITPSPVQSIPLAAPPTPDFSQSLDSIYSK